VTGSLAARVVATLTERGATLGCAESLTGGLLTAAVVDVPGASRVLRGGVVSYAREVKHTVLGVDADLLATRGAVDPDVAVAMARGVCRVLGCDWGVSTTGVAGPDPCDGKAVGTAYVAVVGPGLAPRVVELALAGEREDIRVGAVRCALELVVTALTEAPGHSGG
jgi:nicotinamide-nucleotide amidase